MRYSLKHFLNIKLQQTSFVLLRGIKKASFKYSNEKLINTFIIISFYINYKNVFDKSECKI